MKIGLVTDILSYMFLCLKWKIWQWHQIASVRKSMDTLKDFLLKESALSIE